MPNTQDELCPDYVGEQRITLNLTEPDETPRARTTVFVDVTYDGCDPEGVVLPLVLTVTTERGSSFERRVYRRVKPARIGFTPKEGGLHTIRIGEFAHNRWWGSLTIDVLGDRLRDES